VSGSLQHRVVAGAVRCTAAALLLAAAACSKSPTRVFEAMEEAARNGDAAEFASHFTSDSRPFAEALLVLYAAQSPAEGPLPPALTLLTRSQVVSEEIHGERADLTVQPGSDPNAPLRVLVFKREDGKWKLDIRETEAKNAGRE